MSKISYSAVVLDERSRERLLRKFQDMIPEGWEVIGHHMTINMGEIDPELERYLGMPVPLNVVSFGQDDKVMAVGVTGFETANSQPHITLAVNRNAGGKPFMSNNLTRWDNINRPLRVVGKVTEVPYGNFKIPIK